METATTTQAVREVSASAPVAEAEAPAAPERDHPLDSRVVGRLILEYAPTSFLPMAFGLLTTVVFTRILSLEGFGRYSLALSASTFVTSVCSQWVQHGVNRFLPTARGESHARLIKGGAVISLAAVALLVSIVGALASVAAAAYLPPEWVRVVLPAAVLALMTSIFWPLGSILQSELRGARYSLYHVANAALRFGFALLLTYAVAVDPASLLWGGVLAGAVVIPPIWRDSRMPSLAWMRARFARVYVVSRQIARYGVPMVGWVVAATLLEAGDRYVIQFIRGSAEMGIYAANYVLVNGGVALVATPVLLAAHPLLMRAWEQNDREDAARWLRSVVEWFVVFGVLLVAITSLFAQDLANLLLGEDFREGYRIIPVVLAGTLAWQLGMYTHKPLEFAGRTRFLLGLSMAAATLNIGLNIILVSRFGYIAAAYTTLVTYGFYVVATAWTGSRVLKWSVRWRRLVEAVVVSVGGALLASVTRTWVEAQAGYLAGLGSSLVFSLVIAAIVLSRLGPVIAAWRARRALDLEG